MNKKIVVAVIDSGINMKEQIFLDRKIKNYRYREEKFELAISNVLNTHGSEVIRVLLHEDSDLEVVSIQTLQDNNRCSVFHIVKAIEFCIELRVDVINMSLGAYNLDQRKKALLQLACEKAVEAGITIFAADNNVKTRISYPANFDNVISIKVNSDDSKYCDVSYQGETISFSESAVYIPVDSRCTVRSGTSYLCPLVVGLFCRFVKGRSVKGVFAIKEFFEYMRVFSQESNIKKIYVDRKNPKEYEFLYGKNILFFADEMDFNNIRILEFYQGVSNVRECFSDIYLQDKEKIRELLRGVDVFYIGVLGGKFINANLDYLEELLLFIGENGVDIFSVLPIINTNKRIECTKMTGKRLSSIYK